LTQANYQSGGSYSFFNSLEGRITPLNKVVSQGRSLAGWQPFHGIKTLQKTGILIDVDLRDDLLPGEGFTRGLPWVREEGSGVQFLEPPPEN
jgi:hypothetical protein